MLSCKSRETCSRARNLSQKSYQSFRSGLFHGSRSHANLSALTGDGMPNPGANYVEKERKMHDSVTSMRKEAQDYRAWILNGVKESVRSSSTTGPSTVSSSSTSTTSSIVKRKLLNAINVMQEGLVEREAEVRLLLLAAMSGEHILLIGPPGTAKSEVGRRLSKLISGSYFERLLTRFSVPEELFGPLSMRALEEDKYVRQTRGYLPEAEVAFIDEIFKANSAILNTLLTLINERLFDNGSQRVPVPLITVVGASNELPESEELDALYDRFLVRKLVKQVSSAGVSQMLTYYSGNEEASGSLSLDNVAVDMLVTREDIRNCKTEALKTVRVPQAVIQMLTDLRTYLQEKLEPPVYISDRRLVKAIQLLQVAAFCNGRDAVTEYDLLLLQHILWQQPEHSDRIRDWVLSQLSSDDGTKQVSYLMSGLFSRACRSLGNPEKLGELKNEAASLRSVLVERYRLVAVTLEGAFPAVLDNLWLGEEEAQAVATALQPKLSKTRTAIDSILGDVATLEVALRNGCDPVTLANLMPRHWADFIRNSDISDAK
ncbi:hypothetical protein CEUSTIGMA_g2135.t1 [Chlamydomonas eustigma]|uniref:AAA+ ATPase domain-containing protein n=1 Tax=Chlamydomonas eustigma TaxID=1157962 RepID=A0A250WV24_9CHLO|nr:hypothetical protein CEUSTIGMA_g2135.t1 [Chlamydomonas eustigma]|eukprot:GAX74687.1 hypothetical protein CEUSTIGMA_g2135.t1 [Chlamydomonas eustigma]